MLTGDVRSSGLRVKICGLRREEDALVALEAGADPLGLVFASSRRQISAERARGLVRRLGPRLAQTVGVFVNAPPAEVNAVVEYCGLDWVQLSGDEPPAECEQIRVPVIKAFHSGPNLREEHLAAYAPVVRVFLLDAFAPGQRGGTGQLCDWMIAKRVAKEYPTLLAGGLTPNNVGEAIDAVGPWGVDVSSGVEIDGQKDGGLITEFVRRCRVHGPADRRQ